MTRIKALLLDVGGVLMTNGWDHPLRQKTAMAFGIDYEEMNRRHQLIFDTFEIGKLTFDEYLNQIIFYTKRNFALADLKRYIFDAAKPFDPMIHFIIEVKEQYQLKVGIVSNEGRELAVDRVQRANLDSFVDFFVFSSFVKLRKPDPDIYRLAIDLIQVAPEHIIYIDDRELLVECAKNLGLQTIHHIDVHATAKAFKSLI